MFLFMSFSIASTVLTFISTIVMSAQLYFTMSTCKIQQRLAVYTWATEPLFHEYFLVTMENAENEGITKKEQIIDPGR